LISLTTSAPLVGADRFAVADREQLSLQGMGRT
jgi:hypothetical protein